MTDKEMKMEDNKEKKVYEKPVYEKKSSLYKDTGETIYYYTTYVY